MNDEAKIFYYTAVVDARIKGYVYARDRQSAMEYLEYVNGKGDEFELDKIIELIEITEIVDEDEYKNPKKNNKKGSDAT